MICFIGFHAKDLWTNGGHIPESNQYKGVNLIKKKKYFSFLLFLEIKKALCGRDLTHFDSRKSAAPDQEDYFLYI